MTIDLSCGMSSHSRMFVPVKPGGGSRRGWAGLLSFGLHAAIIALLLHHPEPRVLKSAASLRGNGGRGAALTDIYLPGESVASIPKKAEERPERKSFPRPSQKAPPPMVESKAQPSAPSTIKWPRCCSNHRFVTLAAWLLPWLALSSTRWSRSPMYSKGKGIMGNKRHGTPKMEGRKARLRNDGEDRRKGVELGH